MTTRVVAGLPHARASWPSELSRWATSGAAPIEFLTCLTANEIRALLASGRRVDAVLLDASSPQVEAGLVEVIAAQDCVPIGVEADELALDWESLGVAARLPRGFNWLQLSDLLVTHCAPVRAANPSISVEMAGGARPGGFLVGVCGSGGTGATTVAMALAQGVAGAEGIPTVLVDGARRADLAMYHDTGEVMPGLPELLERVRAGDADPDEIDDAVFRTGRGYDLLLGQRAPGDWISLDQPSVRGAMEAMCRRWQLVVVDHDGDLEDAEWTRSETVERRNAVSLELACSADLWFIVAGPGTKGVASAAGAVDQAIRAGVEETRIHVIFNRLGRSPATRTSHAAALASSTAARGQLNRAPGFVCEVRRLEAAHRDSARLPRQLVGPVASAFDRARGELLNKAGAAR